ncbi:MAG TPA: YbhB/YbcL family Raf kinase inhibitor-like protein, partial [Pararhizobium sp.]|nr:YbhB/YbcL family Raf kinase inhibitor-like protein [Pararhizobium sp.]
SAYALELKSPAFSNGDTLPKAQVFEGMGCNGGKTSPALSWSGAPKGTKSFALTLYDPDAPTGSGWWHWVVVNIPPNVTKLAKGASNGHMPKGAVQARNDYGMSKFGGACPPPGKPHHYIFTIYALDTAKLPVKPSASGAMAGFNIHAHIIDKATLTAMYGR